MFISIFFFFTLAKFFYILVWTLRKFSYGDGTVARVTVTDPQTLSRTLNHQPVISITHWRTSQVGGERLWRGSWCPHCSRRRVEAVCCEVISDDWFCAGQTHLLHDGLLLTDHVSLDQQSRSRKICLIHDVKRYSGTLFAIGWRNIYLVQTLTRKNWVLWMWKHPQCQWNSRPYTTDAVVQ